MKKTPETVCAPGAGPIESNAERTVSAVVFTDPPTAPSACPAATISAAKYNGWRADQRTFARGVGLVEGGEHRRVVCHSARQIVDADSVPA